MTSSEKWAIWTLGVVALTVIAWAALAVALGNGPWINSVFSLLALTAVPRDSRRRFIKGAKFDERQQAIADKALLAGFRGVWVATAILVVATGFVKGWVSTLAVPPWVLLNYFLVATLLLLAVESVATLVLYRR